MDEQLWNLEVLEQQLERTYAQDIVDLASEVIPFDNGMTAAIIDVQSLNDEERSLLLEAHVANAYVGLCCPICHEEIKNVYEAREHFKIWTEDKIHYGDPNPGHGECFYIWQANIKWRWEHEEYDPVGRMVMLRYPTKSSSTGWKQLAKGLLGIIRKFDQARGLQPHSFWVEFPNVGLVEVLVNNVSYLRY